ncbi:hypothetical protein PkP19E3_20610 [Pseudomonas koreensis]|nr:hypothetical protein PkP19E3_20610 [Pseudomonas koreensis]
MAQQRFIFDDQQFHNALPGKSKTPTTHVWERACSQRRCISQQCCRLIDRFREQARSHRV